MGYGFGGCNVQLEEVDLGSRRDIGHSPAVRCVLCTVDPGREGGEGDHLLISAGSRDWRHSMLSMQLSRSRVRIVPTRAGSFLSA